MGAPLGSGRKEKFLFIDSLRESEVKILETLANWNYQNSRASPQNIALILEISNTTVWYGLKYLQSRGIVRKSSRGSWFIKEAIKEEIIRASVEPKDNSSESSESAQ